MARSKECTENSAMRDDSVLVLSGYHPLSFSSYESVPTRYDQSLVTAVTPRRVEEVAKKVQLERSLVTGRETTPRTPQLLGSDSERFSSLQNTKGSQKPSEQPVQTVGTDPPPTTVCACLWSRSISLAKLLGNYFFILCCFHPFNQLLLLHTSV